MGHAWDHIHVRVRDTVLLVVVADTITAAVTVGSRVKAPVRVTVMLTVWVGTQPTVAGLV